MTVANIKRMCQQLFGLDMAKQKLFCQAAGEENVWECKIQPLSASVRSHSRLHAVCVARASSCLDLLNSTSLDLTCFAKLRMGRMCEIAMLRRQKGILGYEC